jgi:diguanylate cyclase (GGDEF)-like protein/PAS domain S-box-containing protein
MTSPQDFDLCHHVLECLPTGVYVVDREGKITFWNAGAERITGYLKQEVMGRLCSDGFLEHSDTENNALTGNMVPLLATIREGRAMVREASLKGKSGHSIPVRLQTIPLRNDHGNILGAVEVFDAASSSSPENRRQSKLSAAGCLDTLTGVLNHAMIQAHLKEQLSLFIVYPVPFVVLCIAIDDLPKLRERFGQAAVDAALRVIAQTLENGLRPTDHIGRWLEQEFVVILTECGEAEVMKVGERLRKMALHAEVAFWGDKLHVTVSVGATTACDRDTVGTIMSRAEGALGESGQNGGNRVVLISA